MTDPRGASKPNPLPPGRATLAQAPVGVAVPALRVSSAQLFGEALEVQIDHHGAVYRLKQTALGKLILTK